MLYHFVYVVWSGLQLNGFYDITIDPVIPSAPSIATKASLLGNQ